MSKIEDLKRICFFADLAITASEKEDDTFVEKITSQVYLEMDELPSWYIWTCEWNLLYQTLFRLQNALQMENSEQRTYFMEKNVKTLKNIIKMNEGVVKKFSK
jgi:hypothetical protein